MGPRRSRKRRTRSRDISDGERAHRFAHGGIRIADLVTELGGSLAARKTWAVSTCSTCMVLFK